MLLYYLFDVIIATRHLPSTDCMKGRTIMYDINYYHNYIISTYSVQIGKMVGCGDEEWLVDSWMIHIMCNRCQKGRHNFQRLKVVSNLYTKIYNIVY